MCLGVRSLHACAFLLGRTPEWTRGSEGGGVAVCDNGRGGRVTHGQEEGMTLCVQMLFYNNCFIFVHFFLQRRKKKKVV